MSAIQYQLEHIYKGVFDSEQNRFLYNYLSVCNSS